MHGNKDCEQRPLTKRETDTTQQHHPSRTSTDAVMTACLSHRETETHCRCISHPENHDSTCCRNTNSNDKAPALEQKTAAYSPIPQATTTTRKHNRVVGIRTRQGIEKKEHQHPLLHVDGSPPQQEKASTARQEETATVSDKQRHYHCVCGYVLFVCA